MEETEMRKHGNARFKQGVFFEAVGAYSGAIALSVAERTGFVYLGTAEGEMAPAEFRKARKRAAPIPILLCNRSAAFHEAGDHSRALEDARAVMELRPEWWKGYLRASQSLAALENWDAARDVLEKGISKAKEEEVGSILLQGLEKEKEKWVKGKEETQGEEEEHSIVEAAMKEDVKELERLFEQGYSPTELTDAGDPILHRLIALGAKENVLRVVLARGANPCALGTSSNAEMVWLFVEKDVACAEGRGKLTAFHVAALHGQIDALKTLESWLADHKDKSLAAAYVLGKQPENQPFTPLFLASVWDEVQAVEFLLDRGALWKETVLIPRPGGIHGVVSVPAILALAGAGALRVARLLRERNILHDVTIAMEDLGRENGLGDGAFHAMSRLAHARATCAGDVLTPLGVHAVCSPERNAEQCAHGEMVQWMVREFKLTAADLDKPGHEGERPLTVACANNHPAMVRVLVECGVIPRVDALRAACKVGALECVRILLEAGASAGGVLSEVEAKEKDAEKEEEPEKEEEEEEGRDVDSEEEEEEKTKVKKPARGRGRQSTSPIVIAISNGHMAVARLLMKHGVDCNEDGTLSQAVGVGMVKLVEEMLDRGTFSSEHLCSALFVAAAADDSQVVRVLMQHGADPLRMTNFDALSMAITRGCNDVLDFMLHSLEERAAGDEKFKASLIQKLVQEDRGKMSMLELARHRKCRKAAQLLEASSMRLGVKDIPEAPKRTHVGEIIIEQGEGEDRDDELLPRMGTERWSFCCSAPWKRGSWSGSVQAWCALSLDATPRSEWAAPALEGMLALWTALEYCKTQGIGKGMSTDVRGGGAQLVRIARAVDRGDPKGVESDVGDVALTLLLRLLEDTRPHSKTKNPLSLVVLKEAGSEDAVRKVLTGALSRLMHAKQFRDLRLGAVAAALSASEQGKKLPECVMVAGELLQSKNALQRACGISLLKRIWLLLASSAAEGGIFHQQDPFEIEKGPGPWFVRHLLQHNVVDGIVSMARDALKEKTEGTEQVEQVGELPVLLSARLYSRKERLVHAVWLLGAMAQAVPKTVENEAAAALLVELCGFKHAENVRYGALFAVNVAVAADGVQGVLEGGVSAGALRTLVQSNMAPAVARILNSSDAPYSHRVLGCGFLWSLLQSPFSAHGRESCGGTQEVAQALVNGLRSAFGARGPAQSQAEAYQRKLSWSSDQAELMGASTSALGVLVSKSQTASFGNESASNAALRCGALQLMMQGVVEGPTPQASNFARAAAYLLGVASPRVVKELLKKKWGGFAPPTMGQPVEPGKSSIALALMSLAVFLNQSDKDGKEDDIDQEARHAAMLLLEVIAKVSEGKKYDFTAEPDPENESPSKGGIPAPPGMDGGGLLPPENDGVDRCARCRGTENLKKCGGCKSVQYCGAECQKEDWHAGHKNECRYIRKKKKKAKSKEQ